MDSWYETPFVGMGFAFPSNPDGHLKIQPILYASQPQISILNCYFEINKIT